MTVADPTPGPAQPPRGPGCLMLIGLALAVAFAGWFVAMAAYVLLVEQWALIAVPREFSYSMALVWAPLVGLVAAVVAALLASRRSARARAGVVAAVAAVIALIGVVAFVGLGAIL